MSMFCNQCQEAKGNFACTSQGVCGKSSDLSNLQDLLVFLCQEISEIIYSEKIESRELDGLNKIIIDSLFMTITNANFDESFIKSQILKLVEERNLLVEKYSVFRDDLININPTNIEELSTTIKIFNIDDEDKKSLSQLIVYGIKGLAAYLHHARNLGYEDESIYDFLYLALARSNDKHASIDELFNLSLKTGEYGVKAMELLDMANTKTFGHPEITDINIGVRNRPAILVSGHDLKDLKDLLDQTKGQGVDVYTHSEMLAAHSYPIFKEYDHFVGNYGNAWWQQAKEFKSFNGPILFTTNCIVPPKDEEIKDRIFTTGPSAYPGTKYIGPDKNGNKDFSEIINLAKKLASPEEIESGYIKGGFAHNQVFELADQVIEEIEKGNIKKFFVMAGCDGRMKSRSYYTDFAKGLDSNTVILTAGCAKYRYNKLDLGDINGIPRLLDAGQCNDSYSLVLIALKLQETLNLENINDLPIEYNISWYEQKAVIVLLSLLYLGVKDIYLGPSLPAFLSENILNILVDKFGISAISSVDKDLEYLMNK